MAEINLLGGQRFDKEANQVFKMPFAKDDIDFESEEFVKHLEYFVSEHKKKQLPRLEQLKRYYLGDNNINYRSAKLDQFRADNRISSDYGRYITTFMQGYILGNPIVYSNADDSIQAQIEEFNARNSEAYHNTLIEIDLSIYGRAYELLYRDDDSKERIVKLNPEECFVIYDATVNQNSICGVRYYTISFDGKDTSYIEVYTGLYNYYYKSDSADEYVLYDVTQMYFDGVQINEYLNNEDRTGDFEAVLDNIDAYDLSQSELANFQEDSNNAYLVIVGNPATGIDEDDSSSNSSGSVLKAMREAGIIILDDNANPDGAKPQAYYLTKKYDVSGVEEFKKRLVNDILRFTFTPDTNDQNFSGVQSGQAMRYKLMGNDNLRATKERLLTKGILRRLRLLGGSWQIKNTAATTESDANVSDIINTTNLLFSPNVPQNDEEKGKLISSLYGMISDQTLCELLEALTGIDAEEELTRLKNEAELKIKERDEYGDIFVKDKLIEGD
ncbi:phage portal protein [Listeria booriae]|uniref:Phage portal protein n=1 Tax=Listeria booriae TaxID=1552123 RepID=A0A7X0YJP3_9LIST|nr:phage portal protein [Listeria booriae]MBC1290622.1 phage portal protein [Listeria booriae]MBC2115694.1 phage portal protein [Listeria booriae]MBC2163427.1 phage portal protein [Listeria booriae]